MTRALPAVVVASATMALPTAVFGSEALAQIRRIAPAESVTVTGCVVTEADYRRAQPSPNRPPGVADEYILVNASTPPSASASPGAGTSTPAPTGTAGTTAAPNVAFELTGTNEKQVEAYVGKRVEIMGTLKAAEVGPDLKLRELDVTSVKEVAGTCTPIP